MNQEDRDQIVAKLRAKSEQAQAEIVAAPMQQFTPQILVATVEMNVYGMLADVFESLRAE